MATPELLRPARKIGFELGDSSESVGPSVFSRGVGSFMLGRGFLAFGIGPLAFDWQWDERALEIFEAKSYGVFFDRRDTPNEIEDGRRGPIVLEGALDEIAVDSIPHTNAFARICVGVEANELANAELVVAGELRLPNGFARVAVAHELDRKLGRPAFPRLPRIEDHIGRAEPDEHVRS